MALINKAKCDNPACKNPDFDRPKGAEKYQKHACTAECFAAILVQVAKETQQAVSMNFEPLRNGDSAVRYGINFPKGDSPPEKGDLS